MRKRARQYFRVRRKSEEPAWYCSGSMDTSPKILFSWHYFFCRGETTLLFLLRQVDTWSSHTGGQGVLRCMCQLLGRYLTSPKEVWEHHDSVIAEGILLAANSWVMYISIVIAWDDTLWSRLSFGSREPNSYLVPWVVILIHILSEALIILIFTSPEVIRGFYWLGLTVDLPVLHYKVNTIPLHERSFVSN